MNTFLRCFLSFCLLLQGPLGLAGTTDFLDNLPASVPRPTGPGDTLDVQVDKYTFNGRTVHTRKIVSCKAGEQRTCYHHEEQYLEPSPVVVHSEFSVPSDDGSYELRTYTTRFENQDAPISIEATKTERSSDYDDLYGPKVEKLEINESSTWDTFGPSIAMGIIGMQEHYSDYRSSVEKSKQLYQDHQNALNNFNKAQQQANASLRAQLNASRTNLILASSGFPEQKNWSEIQKRISEKLEQQEIARKILKDPLAYREYELTAKAQQENIDQILMALENADYSILPKLFEELYYQKSEPTQIASDLMTKYLTKDGILNNEAITGQEGLLDKLSYRTPSTDPQGQVLRRIANQIQAEYAGTNQLDYSSQAQKNLMSSSAVFLNLADAKYASGNKNTGDDYLKAAQSLFEGATGFVEGAAQGLASIVTDLPETAKALGELGQYVYENPELALEKTSDLVANLPEITSAAALMMQKEFEDFKHASPEEKGKILGRLSADFIAGYATLGATRALQLSRAGTKLAQIGNKARQILKLPGNANGSIRLSQNAKNALEDLPLMNRKKLSLDPNKIDDSLDYLRNRESLRAAPVVADRSASINYLDNLHMAEPDYKKISTYDNLNLEYNNLSARIDDIRPTNFEGEIHRAVPLVAKTPNGPKVNTVDTAFEFHDGVKNANGRYSMPGDEAIYASIGDKPHDAWNTVLEEIDHYAPGDLNRDALIIGSKNYRSSKVLDLTNSETLNSLGLSPEDLVTVNGVDKYKLTHQLGNIAKNKGYDAIIAPAARSNGINMIIFRGN